MVVQAAYVGAAHDAEAPDNLDILADWATSWRRKVYGVSPLAEASASLEQGESLLMRRVGRVGLAAAGEEASLHH
jgi:hypothetical protein